MEKPVFIINGFLDGGKTTFIKETLNDPQFLSNGKLLIILCEEGEEEYDEAALAKKGVSIISVEEQSQLTGEFLNGLELYYNPNMILFEMNGMWNMDQMMEMDFPEEWVPAQVISLFDGSTLPRYLTNMKKMVLDLVRYSDIVIINRCDDSTDKTMIRRSIKPVNRKAQIIYERADGKDSGPEDEELPYDMTQQYLEITDEDYGIWYMDCMDNPKAYEGKTVHFLGMLYFSQKFPTGYCVPGRMAMTCCVEDIAFIGLMAKIPAVVDRSLLRNRTWVYVTATIKIEYQKEYQGKGPVLYATKFEPAPEPAEKTVYFT
ncbi:MAG: GTPase [Lachnospiraceae bacterium]|nr:GTPase [Lachnospiraceae bacterium]